MNPTNIFSVPSAPFSFGYHPKFERSRRSHFRRVSLGKRISLDKLSDSRHPEVFIIPRNRFLFVVDEWDDAIGFERISFPFSSTDFYVNRDDEEKLFYELDHAEPFFRLGRISQLGYLVPPRPDDLDKDVSIAYTTPSFHHTRWLHSILVAVLMEIVLARNGFSPAERAPLVLTAGCHDIAMPAGGDSVKRVDPENLDEEKNFGWILNRDGLSEKWNKQFGFNLALAEGWVRGNSLFGRFLDVIDKMAYTAIDCYALGREREGQVRRFCLKYPLVMDVWQDIRFTLDRTEFFFSRPERLFHFLLLRAYEFQELLYNPYSRALDLFLKKLVKPLYKRGIITKEQLLTGDDWWLESVLRQYYPDRMKCYIEPDELSWQKFDTVKEQQDFAKSLGEAVDHTDYVGQITTGLAWLVRKERKIVSLREAIAPEETRLLEEVAGSVRGYYVYYRR